MRTTSTGWRRFWREARPAVFGAGADAHRLPPLDHAFAPGDTLPGGAVVMDAPGHTIGHVAFHFPALKALFTADSLMTHGCGRLFEGTADQMFDTIARFDALPGDTRILSGHDYARANLAFAARFAPDAAALAARQAELPRAGGEKGRRPPAPRWIRAPAEPLSAVPPAAGGPRRPACPAPMRAPFWPKSAAKRTTPEQCGHVTASRAA